MNIYSLHRRNFQKMPAFHFFGEQRKVYKAETSEASVAEQGNSSAETSEVETSSAENSAEKPYSKIKETTEKITKKAIEKIPNIFNGPIPGTPFFNENSSWIQKFIGTALVAPAILKVAQVVANSVAKVGTTTWNYGGKQLVNGAVERLGGNNESWGKKAYGSVGNFLYRGGFENTQRLYYGMLQTVQGVKNATIASISSVLAGTKAIPKSLAIPEHTLRPFAWLTDKIPFINHFNMFEGAKNIIQRTRAKLRTPGQLAWELTKQELVNLKANTSGFINNAKGAALSVVETPLRTITGAVGPKTDSTVGSVISETVDDIQNSSFFSKIFGKDNLGGLRA